MRDPEAADLRAEMSLIRLTEYVDGKRKKNSFWNGRERCLDAITHEVIKRRSFMLAMFVVFNHLSFYSFLPSLS